MTAQSLQVYTGRINEGALFSRHPDLHLIIGLFSFFNLTEGHVKSQFYRTSSLKLAAVSQA